MKRIAFCVVFGIAASALFVGCADKTEVKKTTTVETPGGSTTKTEATTVEKTGEHKDAPANP